ncbi:MAG TPA: hypothetical protein VIL46_04235, partial [Gemmataceae bacterium]
KQGDAGEGKRYAETLIAKAIEQHNAVLLEMAYGQLRTYRDSKEFLAVAVRAADALVRIDGGEQAPSLLYLADAHFRSGDKARAKGCARRAVDAAAGESPDFREYVEKEARRFGAGK